MFSGNGSSEDLEKLSERFVDPEEEEEDMGGWEEEEVTVTTATTQGTTERGGVDVHNATSLPVSLVRLTDSLNNLSWYLTFY